MITTNFGTLIKGSAALQTSVAEQEIIPSGYRFSNFNLLNTQACTISINQGDYIYIRASQGINIDICNSCRIKEDNISFNWIGQAL